MIFSEQTPQVDPPGFWGLGPPGTHRLPSSTSQSPPPSAGPQGGAGVGGQEVPLRERADPSHPAQSRSACQLGSLRRRMNEHNHQVPRTSSPGLRPDSRVTHIISLMVTFTPNEKNLREKEKWVHSPVACGGLSFRATEKMVQVVACWGQEQGLLPGLTSSHSPPLVEQIISTGVSGGLRTDGRGLASLKGPWYP